MPEHPGIPPSSDDPAVLADLAPSVITTSTTPRGPRRGRRRWIGWLFVLPALLLYTFVVLVPALQSVNYSFYRWDGVTQAVFVGATNYTAFFTDPELVASIAHIGVLVIFYAVLPIILGLLSAALLARFRRPGFAVFRWVIFLPQVLTSVVVAVLWKQLYGPDGPINKALEAVGLGALTRDWLGDFTLALPSLGVVGTWTTLGLCMVLFVSGSASISTTLYDAARVDGAGMVREFFAVTLPGLRYELQVVLVLSVIGTLDTFDEIYVMTGGGPGTATSVPAYLVWRRLFGTGQVGSAAALGIVLMLIIFAVTWAINRAMERGNPA
jgi:raffinose/stachyose/melibiose transport system permease protein